MGQNFHICLWSGPSWLTRPPLTISLTVKYLLFYDFPKYIRDSSKLEEELQKGQNFEHILLFKKNRPTSGWRTCQQVDAVQCWLIHLPPTRPVAAGILFCFQAFDIETKRPGMGLILLTPPGALIAILGWLTTDPPSPPPTLWPLDDYLVTTLWPIRDQCMDIWILWVAKC